MSENIALTRVNKQFGNGYPTLESKELNSTDMARAYCIISRSENSSWPCLIMARARRRQQHSPTPVTDHMVNSPWSLSVSRQSRKSSSKAKKNLYAQAMLSPCTNTNQRQVKDWHASSSPVSKRAETGPSISFRHKDSWSRQKTNREDEIW